MKRTTMNSLLNAMIIEHDRLQPYKEIIPIASIPVAVLKDLLSLISDEKLLGLGHRIGLTQIPDAIMFVYRRLDLDTFLLFVEDLLNIIEAKYSKTATTGVISFAINHKLGRNGSLLIKSMFETSLKTITPYLSTTKAHQDSMVFTIELTRGR